MSIQDSPGKHMRTTFQKLLYDSLGLKLFSDFLKNENNTPQSLSPSSISLEFILALDKFKLQWGNSSTNVHGLKELYETFISSKTSKLQVLVPQSLKVELDNVFHSSTGKEITPQVFDKVYTLLFEQLKEDGFKRFLRSPQYSTYIQKRSFADQSSANNPLNENAILCKFPGETLVHKVMRAVVLNAESREFIKCLLFTSNFRLSFGNFPKDIANRTQSIGLELLNVVSEIPLATIFRIERKINPGWPNLNATDSVFELNCKDNRKLEFFLESSDSDSLTYSKSLRKLVFPGDPTLLFAFQYKGNFPMAPGWGVYNIYEECLRQKLPFDKWRISDVNHDFKPCPSYPSKIIVPASITDEQLHSIFSFRSKGRLPCLCWVHPDNGATITRSSQPLVGLTRTRCQADIDLLNEISLASGGKFLYLLDARPKASAVGNTIKGMGYENTSHYGHCRLEFMDIPNIHVIRDSCQKLEYLCQSYGVGSDSLIDWGTAVEDQWLTLLDSTRWLALLRNVLAGATRTANLIEDGFPVLIHCSDGWDRTSQLSSLSMIMLDSYYRTLIGFEVLIEKEWIAFGHKFRERIGHGDPDYANQQRAPIFMQFLDAVFQLVTQFPCSFEFNDKFLVTIAEALYSCQFGTFLFDNELERHEAKVKERTVSLWSYINSNNQEFLNPFYLPDNQVLRVSLHGDSLILWKNVFLKWNNKSKNNAVLTIEMRADMLKVNAEQLAKKNKELEKEIESLKALLGNKNSNGEVTHSEKIDEKQNHSQNHEDKTTTNVDNKHTNEGDENEPLKEKKPSIDPLTGTVFT